VVLGAGDRQLNDNCRTLALGALCRDGAAVRFRDALHDRQPQSGAATRHAGATASRFVGPASCWRLQPITSRALTGLGTLSLYAGLLVSLSFYFTKQIGYRAWRLIHALAYLMFVAVTVHSVLLGADSSTPVMQIMYLLAGSSVLFLTLFRVLTMAAGSAAAERAQTGPQRRTRAPG
jgi:hypothetical protein